MRDLPSPSSRQLVGATIGNYRITALLGEGGMGAVYLAEHPLIGKRVAIKVLHEEFARDPEAVARFFGEARAVNEIGHPNIVDVIDFGQAGGEGGFVYLIMEYLDGRSLAQLLRQGPLPQARALAIAEGIADALAASHERGIVHRDLKPDNVFLLARSKSADFVKVLDFGIAKLTTTGGTSARTRTGVVLGTPAYMSPEQCDGRGHVDARSDVYALGVVLFEMITGRTPFVGEGWGELLIQHLTAPPPRPSELRQGIPPELDALVLRALEKAPEARFQTMHELRAAIAAVSGTPLVAPESSAMPSWVGRIDAAAHDSGRRTPTTLSAAAGERRRPTTLPRVERRRRAGLAVGILCGVVAAAVGVIVAINATHSSGSNLNPHPGRLTPDTHPDTPDTHPDTPNVNGNQNVHVNVHENVQGTVHEDVQGAVHENGQETVPPPVPETVTVTISSAIPARILLDGVDVGATGAPITIPRADHRSVTVTVRARGYRDFTRTITPAVDIAFDVQLKKKHVHIGDGTGCPADDPDCVIAPR